MPRGFPIRTPDPRADRPNGLRVAAIAALGLVAGWLLARATLDEPRGEGAAEDGAAPAVTPVAEPVADGQADAGAAGVGDAGVATAEAEAEAEPESEAESAAETPAAETPSAPPTDRAVRLGRIAYLRCTGAETTGGPYPCPRDLDLERAAIAVLETLPSCPNAPPGTGEADVRVHFEPGTPTDVRLRGGPRAGRLDGPRVLACLREPLSQLTTTIEADELVVSFRFELVPAP